jgi:hypothetical protein
MDFERFYKVRYNVKLVTTLFYSTVVRGIRTIIRDVHAYIQEGREPCMSSFVHDGKKGDRGGQYSP